MSRNQKFYSGEILNFSHILFFVVDIALLSPILVFFVSFGFKIIKQVYSQIPAIR